MSTKLKQNIAFEVIIFILILMLSVTATVLVSTNYLLAQQEAKEPIIEECETYGENHFVYISENRFYPDEIEAQACDLMTVINHDKYRLLAFGQHNNHIEYSGFNEEPLKKDAVLTIKLNQTGRYMIHDHLQDYVHLSFKVN